MIKSRLEINFDMLECIREAFQGCRFYCILLQQSVFHRRLAYLHQKPRGLHNHPENKEHQ